MIWKKKEFYILIDASTNAVLLTCDNVAIAYQLGNFLFDTALKPVWSKNIFHRFFLRQLANSSEPYKYVWLDSRKEVLINRNVNEAVRAKSQFVQKFYKIFKEIYQVIEYRRLRESGKTTLAFQELIYAAKRAEAERFRDHNYNVENILDFPYILQYAELKNISHKQAADEIIFKSKLSNNMLAKTEFMRLKHFGLLKEAKTIEELEEVHKNFKIDMEYA